MVLGAATLQAQYAAAPTLTRQESTKPWSVAATLRGFYDDNYVTRPSDLERDSFGFELSPSVGLNWTLPQTHVGLSYVYGLRYYEDREENTADHSHQANLKLTHVFSERYKVDASDSFVVAQEPEIIEREGTPFARFLRTDGDNLRNTANGTFTAGITEQLSTVLGYTHSLYDYDQEGVGSLSSLLDRQEHLIAASLRWQVVPSTTAVFGYQYGDTEYDNGNTLGFLFRPGVGVQAVPSTIRNSRSHYVFVGADHAFSPQLTASVRGGAQFTEYDSGSLERLFPNADNDTTSPYVDANANYFYREDSYVQLGVRHTRQATDIAFFQIDSPTLDQEATTVYTSLNHRILPKLTGSLLAQYQRAEFEGGGADNELENFLLAGLNLSYEINQFLSAETGYNFDRLDSDIPNRSFTRNRVYVGIRATY